MKRLSTVIAVGAVAVLAACGSSSSGNKTAKPSYPSGSNSSVASSSSSSGAAASATAAVADSKLGKILVDSTGKTLYQRDDDTATTVKCTGACAVAWPPLTVTAAATAGTGIDASKLSTLSDPNGTQVTYGGHPLYRFAADAASGDTKGQGVGGIWWVVGPDGQKVTKTI